MTGQRSGHSAAMDREQGNDDDTTELAEDGVGARADDAGVVDQQAVLKDQIEGRDPRDED